MLYYANPCGPKVVEAMQAGLLGFIDTPAQGNARPCGVPWCADNGCFGRGYPGDSAWLKWLASNAADVASCVFATAPDVVGDAEATLERSTPWLPEIRKLGFPAALVGQDGLERLTIPWDDFDAFFIGGGTEWKLGPEVVKLVAEAKSRGKYVHMGRVNSRKRYKYAESIGCDSADGTFLTFGPNVNLPKCLSWRN